MSTKHTAARYLQALVMAKGKAGVAVGYAASQGHWADREQVVSALRDASPAYSSSDFPKSQIPIADAFLGIVRDFSVPARLQHLRRVPMRVRILVNTSNDRALEVAEGQHWPVLSGSWHTAQLVPRKFGAIVANTLELVSSGSPSAGLAVTADLAEAVAEAENRSFVSPLVAGSVLYGAPTFNSTGATVAAIDADLRALVNLVPGAFRPGAAFVMTQRTATHLATLRDSGGSVAYPGIGPQGGELLHLPVLITSACELEGSPTERIIGLVSPSEVHYADEGIVRFDTSQSALLQLNTAPSAGAQNLTSLFQTDSVGLRGVKEADWYARAGAGAYFRTAGY